MKKKKKNDQSCISKDEDKVQVNLSKTSKTAKVAEEDEFEGNKLKKVTPDHGCKEDSQVRFLL